jgi:hypothetical protein
MASERTERLRKTNYWDELFRIRDQQRQLRKSAVNVVRGADLPLEKNRQGLMRWYLHPSITDTVIQSLIIFEQEIPPGSRSGRVKFQGGQVIYVKEGNGHTLLDGVSHPWQAGDVINLPLKRDGIIVQHVNDDRERPAKLIACEPNWIGCVGVDRGSGFEQLEDSPDYRR